MNMKKFLAMLLAIAMLFAFAACGDDKDDDKKSSTNASDKDSGSGEKDTGKVTIVGKWETEISITELVDPEEIAAEEVDDEELIDMYAALYKDIKIPYVFEVNENGDASFTIGNDLLDEMKKIIETMVTRLFEDGLAAAMEGMTQKEFEEALAEEGQSVKDLIEERVAQLTDNEVNIKDTVAEMLGMDLADLESNGKCKYEGGKLYVWEEGEELDKEIYVNVELTSKKLKFGEASKGKYPISGFEFTKK